MNPWVAYQFDRAVFEFGTYVDHELGKCKTEAQKRSVLQRILTEGRAKRMAKTADELALAYPQFVVD